MSYIDKVTGRRYSGYAVTNHIAAARGAVERAKADAEARECEATRIAALRLERAKLLAAQAITKAQATLARWEAILAAGDIGPRPGRPKKQTKPEPAPLVPIPPELDVSKMTRDEFRRFTERYQRCDTQEPRAP